MDTEGTQLRLGHHIEVPVVEVHDTDDNLHKEKEILVKILVGLGRILPPLFCIWREMEVT